MSMSLFFFGYMMHYDIPLVLLSYFAFDDCISWIKAFRLAFSFGFLASLVSHFF